MTNYVRTPRFIVSYVRNVLGEAGVETFTRFLHAANTTPRCPTAASRPPHLSHPRP